MLPIFIILHIINCRSQLHTRPHFPTIRFHQNYIYCYKVKDNICQNTTGLLAGCSHDYNETTCFGLLGGHHQVYKCYLWETSNNAWYVADVEISSSRPYKAYRRKSAGGRVLKVWHLKRWGRRYGRAWLVWSIPGRDATCKRNTKRPRTTCTHVPHLTC
jgi:hypothetical protein